MNNETLLRAENLVRYYGNTCAVNDVSLDVARGEVVGLLGVNGAGKSTTLQLLSGNLGLSAGNVTVAGYDLTRQARRAKAALGYLPDHPPLYRDMTVVEYLSYCARLHGLSRAHAKGAVARVVEQCGLVEVTTRLTGNLSKGFRQRVGLAQALVHSPPLLILDEPTVGLDVVQVQAVRNLVGDLRAEHGILISTHALSEVEAICDRVAILHRGRLLFAHALQDLRREEGAVWQAVMRNPPTLDELQSLEAVTAAEYRAPGVARLTFAAGSDELEQFVVAAVASGWRLVELTPERPSLEQIFVSVIREDTPLAESAP
jgi:ABC-2 type transport system ATP-binding protein